jgi:SWI/SNF-related matrix-associated actin-dependent regulator 1 of chromatin subfamily A
MKITEKSQYAFNIRFSRPRTQTIHTPNGPLEITKFEGIRNIERLKGYLKGKYLRRLASKVLDLPPLIHKDIILNTQKVKAKELKKAYESHEEGEKSEHIMTLKSENALSKAKDTAEYTLDLVEQGEPVVVYTDHVAPCMEIAERLKHKKVRVGVIHGGTPTDRRSTLVESFQAGNLDVLVCTIGAASTGFTLTRARNLVFNDFSWSYVDIYQALHRIHRIGQKGICIIHYMLSSEMDQWIKKKVMAKEELLGKVL